MYVISFLSEEDKSSPISSVSEFRSQCSVKPLADLTHTHTQSSPFYPTDMASVVMEILQKGLSINLYMFHGGTNFGFMNGALEMHSYKADVTSYGK